MRWAQIIKMHRQRVLRVSEDGLMDGVQLANDLPSTFQSSCSQYPMIMTDKTRVAKGNRAVAEEKMQGPIEGMMKAQWVWQAVNRDLS
jgi:hypothetical protein